MNAPATKHLIIAGVTRAATTSLFSYLADHPRVRPATIKETRFFMDSDELKRMYRFEDGPAAYDRYFPTCPANVFRLEATPDYLYRPAVAKRIAESLADVYVIVILREPIDRLVSWRRYAIQNGLLDADTTLGEYIRVQFDAEATGQDLPQHLRALREGRYSRYLPAWIESITASRLLVRNYSELEDNPAAFLRDICVHVGMDPAFYDHYEFDTHNASRRVRWPGMHSAYRSLIWRLKPLVHDKPAVRNALRGLRRKTDTLLGRAGRETNETAGAGDVLTDADRRRLEDYYRQEPAELARLLGRGAWTW